MQNYSYAYSKGVVDSFGSSRPRGWAVFLKIPVLSRDQVILLFMRKQNRIWELIKRVVITIERNDRAGTLVHKRGVWLRQVGQYGCFLELKGLLNKCLVLTQLPEIFYN